MGNFQDTVSSIIIHNLETFRYGQRDIQTEILLYYNYSINDYRNSLTVISQLLLQVLSLSFQTLTANK